MLPDSDHEKNARGQSLHRNRSNIKEWWYIAIGLTVISILIVPQLNRHPVSDNPAKAAITAPLIVSPKAKLEEPSSTLAMPAINEQKTLADQLKRVIVDKSYYGCKDDKLDDKIARLMASDDELAWKTLLLASLENGDCRRWYMGTPVYLDKVGLARHCVRREGESQCYWTPREAVSRPEVR